MLNVATKRAPHAFNFLRQVRILQKSGCGNFDQQSKDGFLLSPLQILGLLNCFIMSSNFLPGLAER